MSIWADIHKRSTGSKVSKEDFSLIYGFREEPEEICKGNYKEGEYHILTNGMYPYMRILFKTGITIFNIDQVIKLEMESEEYFLTHTYSQGMSSFVYWFNKVNDYVDNLEQFQNGHKYTLDELKRMAEMFIDLILIRNSE